MTNIPQTPDTPLNYVNLTSGTGEAADLSTHASTYITDPNKLLHTLLNDNNLVLTISAISDDNSYVEGKGFIITDKPLLLVTAKYKI